MWWSHLWSLEMKSDVPLKCARLSGPEITILLISLWTLISLPACSNETNEHTVKIMLVILQCGFPAKFVFCFVLKYSCARARAHTHTHTHTHTHPCLLGTSSGLFTRHLQNQIYIFPHLFLLHVTPLPQLLPLLFVIIITPEIYYCFYPQILQKSLDWVGNLPRVMQSQG